MFCDRWHRVGIWRNMVRTDSMKGEGKEREVGEKGESEVGVGLCLE